ncbi:MAG: macro domain-containing protein, partial [Pseudomonas sp.]|nr:macro domain-containing protein [Pseudomonas sp.]
HTVGPAWQGGHAGEAALLASCYRASLQLAALRGANSIAFPAISCGAYGYPAELAVPLAVSAVHDWLLRGAPPRQVVFCCCDAAMAARYRDAVAAVLPAPSEA